MSNLVRVLVEDGLAARDGEHDHDDHVDQDEIERLAAVYHETMQGHRGTAA